MSVLRWDVLRPAMPLYSLAYRSDVVTDFAFVPVADAAADVLVAISRDAVIATDSAPDHAALGLKGRDGVRAHEPEGGKS